MAFVRAMSIVAVSIAGFAIGSGGIAATHAKPKQGKTAAISTGAAASRIVAITNRERARNGLRPLKVDGHCVTAISGHVADMTRGGFLSHQGSDGRGANERYRKYSPRGLGAGENVAYNRTGTGESFMQQWLGSSTHRGNILNPRYSGIGVAVRATCSTSGKERSCTYYAGQCFSLAR